MSEWEIARWTWYLRIKHALGVGEMQPLTLPVKCVRFALGLGWPKPRRP